MAKCQNENCNNEATHAMTLNVPAKDVPIDLHTPIKMYVGLELCLEHAKEFGKDFTWKDNRALQEAIEAALGASGRSEPDFDRTFHSAIPLHNDGYRQFLKLREGRSSS